MRLYGATVTISSISSSHVSSLIEVLLAALLFLGPKNTAEGAGNCYELS